MNPRFLKVQPPADEGGCWARFVGRLKYPCPRRARPGTHTCKFHIEWEPNAAAAAELLAVDPDTAPSDRFAGLELD